MVVGKTQFFFLILFFQKKKLAFWAGVLGFSNKNFSSPQLFPNLTQKKNLETFVGGKNLKKKKSKLCDF